MATLSKNVITLILSLALLLFFFHGYWCNFIGSNFHHHHHRHHQGTLNRKRELIATKFDFKPFMRHHHHHLKHLSPPPESEIDPIYGVEKRLVPTGPNPLHH
ncbi:hypothetical protein RND71_029306 [Anisodus tanguticus]|uniref:CLAVATA3/ESR (CLE)-related protein 13 n=1 Tax=Anisodus tanguticus TaxID=243964 RepID=A0AAE1REA8_9SOLA|nr:hypothetical protein RND71_029306 [Anisodus tanguticus]